MAIPISGANGRLVSEDHPARFLREVVPQLELGAYGFQVPTGERGLPGSAPPQPL